MDTSAGLRPYPQYRRVHATGISSIPAHWRVVQLRRVVRFRPSPAADHLEPGAIVSFLPMEAIGEDGTYDRSITRRVEAVDEGYTHFGEGDVIRAKVTPCFENGKGAYLDKLIGGHGFGTTELFVMRPDKTVDARFLYYLTMSDPFVKIGASTIYGAHGVKRVSEDFVRSFVLGLPPLSEQRAIADYLDRETVRVDLLMRHKQELVAKLGERLCTQIHRLVTKGTRSQVPMVESGLMWAGTAPSHWSIRRVKHVATLESGHTPSRQHPEYWENCTISWVSLADVQQFRDDRTEYINCTAENVSELGLANSSARLLPADTVILSRTASVGFSCILGRAMATTQDFANWICGPEILPGYLLHVFRSMRQELSRLTMGSTHKTIYMPDIARFAVPLPPLDEQREIVTAIRHYRLITYDLIGRLEAQISRFAEYRGSIITAAVSGQFDPTQVVA